MLIFLDFAFNLKKKKKTLAKKVCFFFYPQGQVSLGEGHHHLHKTCIYGSFEN